MLFSTLESTDKPCSLEEENYLAPISPSLLVPPTVETLPVISAVSTQLGTTFHG